MNTARNWVAVGAGIEGLGGVLLQIAFDGAFPPPFAVLVISVGSAVLLIGLIAAGVKVGLKDAGLAVQQEGDAPVAGEAPTPADAEESAASIQRLLADGPATNEQLYAFTGLKERELRAALDLLSRRGVVEMGTARRWQLRSE